MNTVLSIEDFFFRSMM